MQLLMIPLRTLNSQSLTFVFTPREKEKAEAVTEYHFSKMSIIHVRPNMSKSIQIIILPVYNCVCGI